MRNCYWRQSSKNKSFKNKKQDAYIPYEKLEIDINKLKSLIDNNQANEVKDLLNKIIKLYKSNSEIVDHIYTEQTKTTN